MNDKISSEKVEFSLSPDNLEGFSWKMMHLIIAAMADGATVVGLDGKVLGCNDAILRLHGISRDEYVGRNVYDFIAPEDRQRAIHGASEVLEKGILRSEVKALRKKGGAFDAEVDVSLLRYASGEPMAFLGVTRDITERKKMEEELRRYSEDLKELIQNRTRELLESEKRYSVLVEEASDGVVILQDEKIVFINKKAAEMIGYPGDGAIGLPFLSLIDEKYRQHAKEKYRQILRGEARLLPYEAELIAKNGERISIEYSSSFIHYQGRPADLVIIRDISMRKRAEEQRLDLGKLVAIGELATMVAHDLRDPLTSIRNASFFIKNACFGRAGAEFKAAIEMFDIIEQETIFASAIIDDLLDFAATRPLEKKRESINKLIEDSLTQSDIPENIAVKRNFAKKAVANVDEKQMTRVFLNLIKNAVEAMPTGGKLTIATNETEDHVEIRFIDTGPGIPEENLSKLFKPFFTTKTKGTGIGLAICKKIVEQHNGTIGIKSKIGQGSSIIINLPKREEANNQ